MADAKFDLSKPAFGPGSEANTTDDAVAEPVEEREEIQPESDDSEEGKVKYSRFKKFHDRALEAEEEAAHWRSIAESIKQPQTEQSDLPESWRKLYGDSDASREAWQIQSQSNEALIKQARQEALDAVRNERYEEATRTESNIEKLDEGFEDLSAIVGRDLTDKEQSALLDIVDEFTPKDRDGNYQGAILPFEKAWDIYELKQQVQKSPNSRSRDQVASLTGTRTQGEPSITEKDKNFNPLDWNAWRSRI